MSSLLSSKTHSAVKTLKELKKKNGVKVCVFPNVQFKGLEKNEKMVLLVRAHPVFLFLEIIKAFFLFGGLLFIVLFFATLLEKNNIGIVESNLIVFKLFLVGISFLINYTTIQIVKWFYNIFLISTKRLLDLDFISLTQVAWTSTRLENIEDVEVKPTSFLHVLLKLGNIYIQTAAAQAKIELLNVPHPIEIKDVLLDFAELRRNQNNVRVKP